MEDITVTTRELYLYTLLLNVGFGILLGLVPLVTGFIKRRRKEAFLGFVLSIVGGALLGLLLAVPIAAIFTWLVFKRPAEPANNDPSVN